VRKYAGDVPHHAVLEELRRLALVREENGRVELVTAAAPTARTLAKSLSGLLALVSDAVALSTTRGRAKGVHHLTLRAADARESIAMYGRATASAASFVSGLDQSLRTGVPARRSNKRGSQVTVRVPVRLKESDSKTRRHRNVARD
jgi:hypothetical protein